MGQRAQAVQELPRIEKAAHEQRARKRIQAAMNAPMKTVEGAAVKRPWVPNWLWRLVSTPAEVKLPDIGLMWVSGLVAVGVGIWTAMQEQKRKQQATTTTFPKYEGKIQ
jgi:hypothetical protein